MAVDTILHQQRIIPHMALGLMAFAVRMSRAAGVTDVGAIMEPSLIRLLQRLGVRWKQVGPRVEYHGLRQPCVARVDDLVASVATERPDIYEIVSTKIANPIRLTPA